MKFRNPPGPTDYLFGMRTMSRMKADVLGSYSDLQRAYGDSVSFTTGPYRLFVFFHPDQVHDVLVTQAKSLIRLPHVMKTLAQWNGSSVLIAEGEQWIRQRRLVQPAFQPRRLQNYGRTMVASARRLVESWRGAMNVLDRVVWRFVRERRKDGSDHGDLLSMLLAAVDEESGDLGLGDRQVRNEAMTLMLAGHDTTASALDWLWYNIARFPEVARRCHEEVDSVVGTREPVAHDVDELHYLVATIKETLRLFPPAIGVFLRQATSDLTIGGYDVPRKSLITLSSFVTQRDPRWFPEPDRFDPQRFLSPRIDEIPGGAYFPFGAGPRVCIGQSFAMTEMALIAASMLQSCEVTTIPGANDPTLDVKMALRPKNRLMLRWKRREA